MEKDNLKDNEILIGNKKIGLNTTIKLNLKTLFIILGILYGGLSTVATITYFNLKEELSEQKNELKKEISDQKDFLIKEISDQKINIIFDLDYIKSNIDRLENKQNNRLESISKKINYMKSNYISNDFFKMTKLDTIKSDSTINLIKPDSIN